jgi:hypothetical protein
MKKLDDLVLDFISISFEPYSLDPAEYEDFEEDVERIGCIERLRAQFFLVD